MIQEEVISALISWWNFFTLDTFLEIQIKFRTWRKPWSIFSPLSRLKASSASSFEAPKFVETDNSHYTLWRDNQLFWSTPPRFIVSEWRLACRFYLACNYMEWTWPTDGNIFSKQQRLHFLPPTEPQQPEANFSFFFVFFLKHTSVRATRPWSAPLSRKGIGQMSDYQNISRRSRRSLPADESVVVAKTGRGQTEAGRAWRSHCCRRAWQPHKGSGQRLSQ